MYISSYVTPVSLTNKARTGEAVLSMKREFDEIFHRQILDRRPIVLFVFLSCPSVFYVGRVHAQGLKVKKGQIPHQRELLCPTEDTTPETPRQ